MVLEPACRRSANMYRSQPGFAALSSQRIPRRIARDIDHLVPVRSAAGSEDRDDLGGPVAGIERGVHNSGRNEGGIAGAEDALLAIDPLLDASSDDEDHLLLVRVLVEIVSLARF